MSSLADLLVGSLLSDRYRVMSILGRGAMGVVYRAMDERLERSVAVKVIAMHAASSDAREKLRARFHREARAAARLHHPNVASVFDYGTDAQSGLDFLVMELLTGEDLATRLERSGTIPVDSTVEILRQAALGLAAGHRAGLVHRDVKPANLFLSTESPDHPERVRLLDFGIALWLDSTETLTHLTQAGPSPLTPAYAAPELHHQNSRITPASDIFSLGATAFQMLSGTRPFPLEQIATFRGGQPVAAPPLRSVVPTVPPPVAELVDRMLAYDPRQRYADGADLLDALERARKEMSLEAIPAPKVGLRTTGYDPRPRWSPPRIPSRAVAILGALALSLLLGTGSLRMLRSQGLDPMESGPEAFARCTADTPDSVSTAWWRLLSRVCARAARSAELEDGERTRAQQIRLDALLRLERFRAAVPVAREVVRLRPRDPVGFRQLGTALEGTGNYEEALWAFEQANVLRPDADTYLLSASTLSTLERYGEAYDHLERAAALDPSVASQAGYQQRLGSLLFYLGRRDEALVAHRRVTVLMPEWLDGWGNLGLAAHLSGLHEEAVAAYEEALRRDPAYFESRPDHRARWVESRRQLR